MNAKTRAQHGFNLLYVSAIAAAAALGGLLFGYDWVVIGGAKPFYEPYFHLRSPTLIGWAMSCALLGCLAGSVLSGALSDWTGRKRLLILGALLFTVSSVCTGWAPNFSAFIGWRVVGGVAIGIASNVSPTYIAEVSPAPWRGRLVALNQLTLVVGILAAQSVNWLIADSVPAGATAQMIYHSWNGQLGWRWMFTAVAAPSAVFLLAALFIPESPRWLLGRRAVDSARRTLSSIGGQAYAARTIEEIQASLAVHATLRSSWRELLLPGVPGALATGIGLAVLQQWSGINILFNYAEEVYRGAGYGVNGMLFNVLISGTINLVGTVIALCWVDRFGRRSLMLFGCAGIACAHLLLGFAYAGGIKGFPVLVLTLCAIGCYAVTLAPVTWVLISELFPNRIRGLAVAISVSALWIACFALTFTFPVLSRSLGMAGLFFLYSAICIVGFVFILLRVPETKGKTLEEIERGLLLESD